MHTAKRTVAGHRIYGAALVVDGAYQSERANTAEDDGAARYYAGVVVVRVGVEVAGRGEVFRDERLEDGKVWADPELALTFALEVGEAAVRAQEWLAGQLAEGLQSGDEVSIRS